MGTSWGEESFLGSALLSVYTYYFLCLFPWPLAFFSESSSLLFPSIQGLYPCKHSLTLVLLSWEMGDSWQCFFAGADLWMPFGPGSRVPEGGSGRVDQLGAGASGSHWSWAGSMAYNMWAHMVPQVHARAACAGVLSAAFLLHGTSGSCVGLGTLKNHQFLLGSGTRVGLQLESSHQLLELQGIKSWSQVQKR